MKVPGIVYRQGDLTGNQREKAHLLGRVRVDQPARHDQAAEMAMRGAEWQGAERTHAELPQAVHRLRKTRFLEKVGDDDDLLVLVHPPRERLLGDEIREGMRRRRVHGAVLHFSPSPFVALAFFPAR